MTGANPAHIGANAPAVKPRPAFAQTDLVALSRYFALLMMRNITSDGYVIEDPTSPGVFSAPGCIIAAPSYPANTPGVDQDYVFNWVRDGAITAIEIALAGLLPVPGGVLPSLVDYVNFAALCQANAKNSDAVTLGHACFTITGEVRPWSEQNDGPAIQSIAILTLFDQLDGATQTIAKQLVETNLAYLLEVYQNKTTNLWEEYEGYSFFARAVQLRFFREISTNTIGIAVPAGVADAISWLESQLATHWNGQLYVSILDAAEQAGYDANIDIVSSVCYGGIEPTDTKLLATAAILRRQWADPSSSNYYRSMAPTPPKGSDHSSGAIQATITMAMWRLQWSAGIPGPCAPPTSPSFNIGLPMPSMPAAPSPSISSPNPSSRNWDLAHPAAPPKRRLPCGLRLTSCCAPSSITAITTS
ncbi:hypothetical protein GGE45_004170 [Rhizobium aethiopicum]|nr:hypothetical protein [Rhizobium aethiopicum]